MRRSRSGFHHVRRIKVECVEIPNNPHIKKGKIHCLPSVNLGTSSCQTEGLTEILVTVTSPPCAVTGCLSALAPWLNLNFGPRTLIWPIYKKYVTQKVALHCIVDVTSELGMAWHLCWAFFFSHSLSRIAIFWQAKLIRRIHRLQYYFHLLSTLKTSSFV